MEPATTPMSALIQVVTQVTTWFTDMMSTLFQNQLFLVVFAIFIVGAFFQQVLHFLRLAHLKPLLIDLNALHKGNKAQA